MTIPLPFIAGIIGLFIGSFLNVCIYRMPRNESIVFPPSRCPACGGAIRPWDNLPVVSYLLLGGKCRSCRAGIPIRYPAVELLTGFHFAAVFWRFGASWDSVAYALLCSALIVVTFIDLDFQIIPDRITLPGIPLGLFLGCFMLPDPFLRAVPLGWQASLIGAAAGFLFYYTVAWLSIVLLKKEGMGGGDIKLMAMLGAMLGWKAVILTTFLGSIAGSIIGILVMLRSGRGRGTLIPFGPFLALGAVITLFFGQEILLWYLR